MARFFGVLALVSAAVLVGCEDDGGGSDSGGSSVNSVVGTWAVTEGTTPSAATATTWWEFRSDGTFTYFNDAALTSEHLSGTYVQDGNRFFGPFVNPGVGNGDIDGTLSDDGQTFQMNFIEHWHSPSKVVPQAGARL
jgi:hypothetical protein